MNRIANYQAGRGQNIYSVFNTSVTRPWVHYNNTFQHPPSDVAAVNLPAFLSPCCLLLLRSFCRYRLRFRRETQKFHKILECDRA